MFNHLTANGGGEVYVAPFDTVLTDVDVFQPDIVFVADADLRALTEANIRGNPTWVIEVLSNPYYERDKLRRYEAVGVAEYWLVNPYENTLSISLASGTSYGEPQVHAPPERIRSASLPELEIDLGYVFER